MSEGVDHAAVAFSLSNSAKQMKRPRAGFRLGMMWDVDHQWEMNPRHQVPAESAHCQEAGTK